MGRRLLWMVGLYIAGVAVVGAVALAIRLLMTAAGMIVGIGWKDPDPAPTHQKGRPQTVR